jgi:ATP synthase protein I
MSPEVVRPAFIATAIAGLLSTLVAWFVSSSAGLIGAVFASVLVLGFFLSSHIFVTRMMSKDVRLGMTAALLSYVLKILAMFVLLLLFRDTTLFDTKVFGLTIVLLTLVWTTVEVVAFSRFKTLTVVPGSGPEQDRTPDPREF